MRVLHNGVELNQEQLDAIVPVLNESMNGRHRGKKRLNAAIDKALEEAGCPAVKPQPDERATSGAVV